MYRRFSTRLMCSGLELYPLTPFDASGPVLSFPPYQEWIASCLSVVCPIQIGESLISAHLEIDGHIVHHRHSPSQWESWRIRLRLWQPSRAIGKFSFKTHSCSKPPFWGSLSPLAARRPGNLVERSRYYGPPVVGLAAVGLPGSFGEGAG